MNQEMIKIEPHFLASYLACESACALLDIMPNTDLVEELRNLIYIQHDLMTHIIEGKHYGSDNISEFVQFTQQVKDEVARLRED